MDDQTLAFEKVLRLLDDAECLDHVILIGSWAEFVYREAGILEGFAPNIRTLDVDFLVRNLRRPNPPANLVAVAREAGYLVQSDRLDGTTRIFDTSGLEIEFLINKLGAGVEETLRTNIGVTAQALRHLGVLASRTLKLECLGHMVVVPTPEAYAVHKMVINSRRGGKSQKDAEAVAGLWPYLDQGEVMALVRSLTKKEAAAAQGFMRAKGLGEVKRA